MRIRKTVVVLFVLLLIVALLPLTTTARPAPQATIEQALLDRLLAEGSANFFVKMAVDADLSAAYGMSWHDRGVYVWNALNDVAAKTQAPVIEFAKQHGLDYTSMLTTNSVFIRGGDLNATQGLAALLGVAYLRLERIYQVDPLVEAQGPAPEYSVAWGIPDTNADDVWALGYQGDGIKVASIDTGVQVSHPALDQAFACASPSDPACWKDPFGNCGGSVCDTNGHGTHTMGTMVGDNDASLAYWVGMAPDATWIACHGCRTTSCYDSDLNTCADWILAPGGNAGNRPNVVNNSWGGGGDDNWYLANVNAWRAAGIFPAFSAGNSGSSCGTLGSPGDYDESFASAAHDSARTVAYFSSRGPSAYGHDPYTKPNISAPGYNVRSAYPTNTWALMNGTSMASPHTAGAVALVWSACPSYLGNIDGTFQLLQNNTDTPPAGNCSAPPDGQGNYTYGYGYLNVLKAVQACAATCTPVTNAAFTWTPALPTAGQQVTFSGTASGSAPISYAWTFGDGGAGSGATVNHAYTTAGDYIVTMTAGNACGSDPAQDTITIQPAPAYSLHIYDLTLSKSGTRTYKITAAVTVHDQAHAPAAGATVYGTWTLPNGKRSYKTAVTDSGGVATLSVSGKKGTYELCVTNLVKTGYTYNSDANEHLSCESIVVP